MRTKAKEDSRKDDSKKLYLHSKFTSRMENKYRVVYVDNLKNILSFLTFFEDKVNLLSVNSKFYKIIQNDKHFNVRLHINNKDD